MTMTSNRSSISIGGTKSAETRQLGSFTGIKEKFMTKPKAIEIEQEGRVSAVNVVLRLVQSLPLQRLSAAPRASMSYFTKVLSNMMLSTPLRQHRDHRHRQREPHSHFVTLSLCLQYSASLSLFEMADFAHLSISHAHA